METTQEDRADLERICDYYGRQAAGPSSPVSINVGRLRDLLDDANLAAAYERACVRRSEGAPEWATHWSKGHIGCEWHCRGSQGVDAPDLQPDLEGPVTLPVVDL